MVQCLITKLKGVVNNDSLPKLGELIIEANDANDETLEFYGTDYENIAVRTSGNVTLSDGDTNAIKKVSGTGKIFLSSMNDKYPIGIITWKSKKLAFPNLSSSFLKNCYRYNINAGGYEFQLKSTFTELSVVNARLEGTFGAISIIDCNSCVLNNDEPLNLNTLNVSNLTAFSWSSGKITGDISCLDSVHAHNLLKQKNLDLWGNTSKLTGDVSKMLKDGGCVLMSKEKVTWSNRPSDYKILSIGGCNLGTDVDQMLIDQAKLDAGDTYYSKTIDVVGTRTSASDAAVTTLQGKGFTISVTPAKEIIS